MAETATGSKPKPEMEAPASGVTVRMYRQGHGDCFLLCFPRKNGGDPVFMLIDCGYKGGSQITVDGTVVTVQEVVADIRRATGGKLDVVAVTHEHEDHVNGLRFLADFEIGEAWFAWTEDPEDKDANDYRRRHRDQLLGLMGARNRLEASPEGAAMAARMDRILALEFGTEDWEAGDFGFGAAGGDPAKSANKRAMKVIKDRATKALKFISPHKNILSIEGAEDIRIFPLGPPRSEALLRDEDPTGDAAFPGHGYAGGPSLSFFAAASESATAATSPFAPEHGISSASAQSDPECGAFFSRHYGKESTRDGKRNKAGRVTDPTIDSAAAWRRIDEEWLFAAENFALKMNSGVNNTSLVLAFELPKTRKVLLFAADAQSGNWKSWTAGTFKVDPVDGKEQPDVTCRELMSRTVLYKVGHHGSHNATLTGKDDSPWAHLEWMAEGRYRDDFTAMITAHRKWAIEEAEWDHPLQAIKDALMKKTQGRVLQLDMPDLVKPDETSRAVWDRFIDSRRTRIERLYIEHTVEDGF